MEQWSVGGYTFGSEKDAEIAREEEKKITYLEARMNYKEPESVLQIYKKILENRLFVTPVGHEYLVKLQNFLVESKGISKEQIPKIPLFNVYSPQGLEAPKKSRKRIEGKKGPNIKRQLRISIALNILFVCMLIAMFVVALNAENPNILNYKSALENRYAEWEQELKEREAAVKLKERELKRNTQEREE